MSSETIIRQQFETIKSQLFKGKTLVLIGPRQTGKTTLINELLNNSNKKNKCF